MNMDMFEQQAKQLGNPEKKAGLERVWSDVTLRIAFPGQVVAVLLLGDAVQRIAVLRVPRHLRQLEIRMVTGDLVPLHRQERTSQIGADHWCVHEGVSFPRQKGIPERN